MARCPFAEWRGPVPNQAHNVSRPARGLVLHVIVGSLSSADESFHKASFKASAHFGVSKDGHIVQWVDTADEAWAQAAGNPDWYSVETEGVDTEPLTPAQVVAVARLLLWLRSLDHFPLQVTDDVNGQGLTSHRCGGKAWGGHSCPGDQRHAQRADIVALAKQLEQPARPAGPVVHAEEADMAMIVIDPKGADDLGRDSHWEVTKDGNVNNWNAARPLKSLGQLVKDHAPIVAAVLDPSGDGVVMFADDAHQDERGHWVRSTYKVLVSS